MNRRTLALPLAAGGLILSAGAALAWPANSIQVETTGCTYTIQINQDQPNAFIGWEIRVYAAVPSAGALVDSGSGTADAQGHLTVGPLSAPPGHYNALVDYTLPVSQWAEVVDFTLTCSQESAPASEAPTGSELPIGGIIGPTPTPGGGELGAEGTPPAGAGAAAGATPPPTSTVGAVESRSAGPAPVVLLGLAALVFSTLTFAYAARPREARERTRRRP